MPFYSCMPPPNMDGLRLDPCNPSEFLLLGGGGLSSNPHPPGISYTFHFFAAFWKFLTDYCLKITHIFRPTFFLWVIHFLGLKANSSNLQCVNLIEHSSLTSFQQELHEQLANLKTPKNTYTLQTSFIHIRLLNMYIFEYRAVFEYKT